LHSHVTHCLRYIEFSEAADIILLAGDIVAISVIAFVILFSPIRYFIRKRRCCVNVACCNKKQKEEEEDVVRRVESVLKCACFPHMNLNALMAANHLTLFPCCAGRDVENHEKVQMLPLDEPADNGARDGEDRKSVELPVIDAPATPVARTGSRIIRRQSGRFGGHDADSVFRSDSVRRSSGTMQVRAVLPLMVFNCVSFSFDLCCIHFTQIVSIWTLFFLARATTALPRCPPPPSIPALLVAHLLPFAVAVQARASGFK
jgi:hypothetical protein